MPANRLGAHAPPGFIFPPIRIAQRQNTANDLDMKKQSVRNATIVLGALGALGVSGCGDSVTNVSVAAEGAKEIAIKVAPDLSSPASLAGYEAVARATGFARYMPATTHAYMGIYDGKGFVEEIRKSALLKMAEDQLGGGLIPENPDFELNIEENPQLQMVAALLAEEIFVGVGNGAPGQVANMVAFNESYSRQSVKIAMKTLEATLAGEEEFGGVGFPLLLRGLLSDPKGGIGIVEKAQMPPVTFGFKVSDGDLRGQLYEMAAQGIGAMLEGLGPDGEGFAEAVNVERGGSKFMGIKIKGEELVASMPPDMKEGMAQFMDAATVTRLMKMLESKNLVVAIGVHESYLVAFMGSSADDLQIAPTPAESLLSRPEAAFIKSFTGKRLVSLVTMSEELQESSKGASIFGGLAAGVKEGLAETDTFGDSQDLEVLLGLITEQESAILGLHRHTPGGSVTFMEDGLKVEIFGGAEQPSLNLDTPRTYSELGAQDDVLLFANWVNDAAYKDKVLEYIETLGETVYLAAKRVSSMELPEGVIPFDATEAEGILGMFDEQILPHFLELWTGVRDDLVAGLGDERAVIIDLKGALPTVPGLPQLLADEGKAPRMAVVAPARDKERLQSSWKNTEKAINGIIKIVGDMTGENIPMQRPMSSEKNDLKTWFFPFPFQTDDFVLNVSADEKNVFASTSKSYVQSLAASLEKVKAEPGKKGAYFHLDLTVLNDYLSDWIKLLEEEQGAIFGEGSPDAEDLMQILPIAKQVVSALSELKGISSHTRNEGGTLRTSVHFRTGN